jgi:hypothetical protein
MLKRTMQLAKRGTAQWLAKKAKLGQRSQGFKAQQG